MSADRIVLVNTTYDQGDILSDYLQWYLDLGVDHIIVQDIGSTDESHEVLDRFAKTRQLTWFTLPERNMQRYSTSKTLAGMARDRFDAKWIIFCDSDEFLCPQGEDLRMILRKANQDDVTVLNVPRFNMTGPAPKSKQRATQVLTLRIDRPVAPRIDRPVETISITVPYVFTKHPPKTIVRASALVEYSPGTHGAASSYGRNEESSSLRFLHYPYRSFDKLQQKVQNTAAWLKDNPHLEWWWGWNWRRVVKLAEAGRLKEEYDSQFVSPQRAQELVLDGTCAVDETIFSWITRNNALSA